MTESENNPYVPPESDLRSDADTGKAALEEFERFSAWWVFLLSMITMGIYQIYWIYTRTRILNHIADRKISDAFVNTAVSVYIVSLILGMIDGYLEGGNEAVTIVSSILTLVMIVLGLMWVFGFRSRLHEVMGIDKGDTHWLGPVLTFFFQEIYLQYKINQVIDDLQQESI